MEGKGRQWWQFGEIQRGKEAVIGKGRSDGRVLAGGDVKRAAGEWEVKAVYKGHIYVLSPGRGGKRGRGPHHIPVLS